MKKKMLIFNPFKLTSQRGIQQYTNEIECLFSKKGWQIKVVVLPLWTKKLPTVLQTICLLFYQQVVLPYKGFIFKPNMVFDAYNSYSFLTAVFFYYVCVIHDFIPLQSKDWYLNINTLFKSVLYCSAKWLPKLKIFYITREIAEQSEQYKIKKGKSVLPNIVSPLYEKGSKEVAMLSDVSFEKAQTFIKRSQEKKSLLLATITGNDTHKDFNGLLELLNGSGQNIYLVVFGLQSQEELKKYKNIDLIFCSHVSSLLMSHVIRKADFFVFHSLKEGFGRPVAEALLEGTKVLCSDVSPVLEYLTPKAKEMVFTYKDKKDFLFAFTAVAQKTKIELKRKEVLNYSPLSIYNELLKSF